MQMKLLDLQGAPREAAGAEQRLGQRGSWVFASFVRHHPACGPRLKQEHPQRTASHIQGFRLRCGVGLSPERKGVTVQMGKKAEFTTFLGPHLQHMQVPRRGV